METQLQQPKKKKSKIKKIVLIIFGLILIIGFFGVSKRITLTAGNCGQNYKHYYIKPFIGDFFSCLAMRPCGSNARFTRYDAKTYILECLCENVKADSSVIIDYYNKEFVGQYDIWQASSDAEFICNNGPKVIMKL